MKLIDADALQKELGKYFVGITIAGVNILIDNQPTVDAVPVVRCSECKHYASVLCPLSMADGYYWPAHNPNFFCSDGERREKE